MKLADGLNSINMCVVNDSETAPIEYDLVYLIDLDGSFRPNQAIAPTVSTLVASDNKMHLTFLDPSKCVDNTVGCYGYCHNTCFRSMRYYVDGPGQESYKLKVCSRSDHSRCSLFKGGRRGDAGSHEFTAHLPAGQLYDAVFIDRLGKEIMPVQVEEVVEKHFCTSGAFEVKLFSRLVASVPSAPLPVAPPVPVPVATPVKAPVAAPVPVKAPVPVATPVNVPISAPTTGNCNLQWYLYNANTNSLVASLLNGTVVSAPPTCGQTNIEVVVPCNSDSTATVFIELYSTGNTLLHRRKETSPKYFLFGNSGNDVSAGSIKAGTYMIRAVVNGLVYPFSRFTLGGTC